MLADFVTGLMTIVVTALVLRSVMTCLSLLVRRVLRSGRLCATWPLGRRARGRRLILPSVALKQCWPPMTLFIETLLKLMLRQLCLCLTRWACRFLFCV